MRDRSGAVGDRKEAQASRADGGNAGDKWRQMPSVCEKTQQAVPFRHAHDIHGRAVVEYLVLRTRKVVQRRVSGGNKVIVELMKFIVSKEVEHSRQGAGRSGCTGDSGGGAGSRGTARCRGRRSRDDTGVDRKNGRDDGSDRRGGQCSGRCTDGTAGDHSDGRKVDGTIAVDGVAASFDKPLH